MSEIEEFDKFEKLADEKIKKLEIWRLPIRSVLTPVFISVDRFFTGSRFSRDEKPDQQRGSTILSRVSHLLSFLENCTNGTAGSIEDTLKGMKRRQLRDIKRALAYANLCEIAPQVWRGIYIPTVQNGTIALSHPNNATREYEEKDILLAELSLAIDTRPPPSDASAYMAMINSWPHVRADHILRTINAAYLHYLDAIEEATLLPNEAFEQGFGFTREEFQKVRAGLMSIADFCLGMATAAEAMADDMNSVTRSHYQTECFEWIAPCLKLNFIQGTIMGLTSVSGETIEKIFAFLTIKPGSIPKGQGGEGYLPPFIQLGEFYFFSPYTLKIMLPERNLFYVSNIRNKKQFDEIVSRHLERSLLEESVGLLSQVPGLSIKLNVVWDGGEIDLLLFQPATSQVMQIQAKASIPAQGARMTANLESRTLEAVSQLESFSRKNSDYRKRVFEQAFDLEIEQLKWCSGVLSRSSFGTENAWSKLDGIAIFNPTLIRALVAKMCEDSSIELCQVSDVVNDLINSYQTRVVRGWNEESFDVFNTRISLPLLDLDYSEIHKLRMEILEL